MNDVFKEQIIKRKSTTKTTVLKALLIFAVFVIFFLSSVIMGGIGMYVTLAAGFGAYVLMGRMNVEYEYVFTNGELDIDIIYNKTNRKRLFSSHVKEFEVMAHTEDKNHTGDFSNAAETKDYSSGEPGTDKYAFLLHLKGKQTKIIFEPDDMMLKAIATTLTPRKLFLKK